MPGIVGVINCRESHLILRRMIDDMCYLQHFNKFSIESKHTDNIKNSNSFGNVYVNSLGNEAVRFTYQSDDISVIFNGFLSHVDEFSKECDINHLTADAEVVSQLYCMYGEDAFGKLKGSFNCLIHDKKKRQFFILNDRLGLYPLYYFANGNEFFFAAEVKPLLETGRIKKELNLKACADFFTFGYVMQEDTLIEGVTLLSPGSVIRYDLNDEKYVIYNYYNSLEPKEKLTCSDDDIFDALTDAFDKAINDCIDIGDPGFFLTAGLDTRAIISSATSKAEHLRTFTYGLDGCIDEKIATKLSKKLKTDHGFLKYQGDFLAEHAKTAVRMTDGMLNVFHTGGFPANRRIAARVNHMIVGDGGEFARGFYHSVKNRTSKTKIELREKIFHDISAVFNLSNGFNLFNESYLKFMVNRPKDSLEYSFKRYEDFSIKETLNMFYLNERVRKFITSGFVLKRPYYRISYPFLDNNYIELLMRTPEELKCNRSLVHLNIIKRLRPELNRVICEKTMLPFNCPAFMHFFGKHVMKLKHEVEKTTKIRLSRYKHYLMFDKWLRGELRDYAEDILFSKVTRDRGIYNLYNVRKYFDAHLSGKRDYSEQICALLTFEKFMRMYFD